MNDELAPNNECSLITSHTKEKIVQHVKDVANRINLETSSGEIADDNKFVGLDLASGYPGFCLLYGELDYLFPDEGWDRKGHQLLLKINNNLQKTGNLSNCSLWTGLTGLSLGFLSLSRGGIRYQNSLNQLHSILYKKIPVLIQNAYNNLKKGVRIEDYDTISGLTGIGRYLLLIYKNYPKFRKYLIDILEYLVLLATEKVILGEKVPGWYISKVNSDKYFNSSPKGHFNCGLSHGISGPLSLLSLSLKQGVIVEGQKEVINKIAYWLLRWRQKNEYGETLPGVLDWTEIKKGKLMVNSRPNYSWCYGEPGIARALWLAGEALGEQDLKEESLYLFKTFNQQPIKKWNINSNAICHGIAGMLILSNVMYNDCQLEDIDSLRFNLVSTLMKSFNFEYQYCFRNFNEELIASKQSPGVLDGAAGIALALLTLISNSQSNWTSIFLVS